MLSQNDAILFIVNSIEIHNFYSLLEKNVEKLPETAKHRKKNRNCSGLEHMKGNPMKHLFFFQPFGLVRILKQQAV